MEIIISNNAEAVAQQSTQLICEHLAVKSDSVLGLATGGTPIALYRHLVAACSAGEVSFRDCVTFNL